MNPNMFTKVRSKAIMASANGATCSLRIASFIPGLRCAGDDTTVGAHLPVWGKGTSTKVTDLAVAHSCETCHRLLDNPSPRELAYIEMYCAAPFMERLLHGLTETHAQLLDAGVIIVPDGELI